MQNVNFEVVITPGKKEQIMVRKSAANTRKWNISMEEVMKMGKNKASLQN